MSPIKEKKYIRFVEIVAISGWLVVIILLLF